MKYGKLFAILTLAIFCRTASGDTLSLVGGASSFYTGWWGEAWKGAAWCGDTLMKDPSPDTVTQPPDTIKDLQTTLTVNDTTMISESSTTVDSLVVTTTTIQTRVVLRDSPDDSTIDIINSNTTITDSTIVNLCINTDFIVDSGAAATEGASYFDFYYKFRDYYAQLPFVWKDWGGYDSVTIIPYNQLLITYKGLLPVHQVEISFFYATWGTNADTMKNVQNLGDGVGILAPSDTWKTVVIDIPDSVNMPGITGIILTIGNIPDGGGEDTSEVGNLQVQEIALISPDIGTIKERAVYGIRSDRFHFTPKTAGDIEVSVYSLNGALLRSATVKVDPSQMYSLHRLGKLAGGKTSEQVRIVTVRGAGVNLSEKLW